MPLENRVSAQLSAESIQRIADALAVIKAELPFLINLTADERKVLPKMGDGTVSFVVKALEYAKQNPQVVPPFLSLAEFEKDAALVRPLAGLLHPLSQLAEQLEDTTMAAGSEAYQAALVFYQAAKAAAKAGVPGMKTVVDDLSARFAGAKAPIVRE